MKIIFIILALCACASSIRIHSQEVDDDYQNDYLETSTDSNAYVNQTQDNSTVVTGHQAIPLVTSPYCPQCLYDFKSHRINAGCPSKKPPKCDKGTLVITSVGKDYEMCCCNYSNIL